jgi:hypothetical protein
MLCSMFNQEKPENLAGAEKKQVLRVTFDNHLELEFHSAKVNSDGRLLIYRKSDEALSLTIVEEKALGDWRTGQNSQLSTVAPLRQPIFNRLTGQGGTHVRWRWTIER